MPDTVSQRGFVLSFDFGLRRIGVAVGQFTTCTATSLETVSHATEPDWEAIDRLVKEWKPQSFVVGLPLSLQGDETDMSRAARSFGEQLTQRYAREAIFVDERLSSHAAQQHFVEMRADGGSKRKDASKLDAIAARIILENWLQSFTANRDSAA
jgi:putative Holliday junction resolvase